MSSLLFGLVLAPFVGAALVIALPDRMRHVAAWIAGAVALAGCAILVLLAPGVFGGEIARAAIPWLPPLGVDFGFRLDGYAFLFALLICGIGVLVVLYAAY